MEDDAGRLKALATAAAGDAFWATNIHPVKRARKKSVKRELKKEKTVRVAKKGSRRRRDAGVVVVVIAGCVGWWGAWKGAVVAAVPRPQTCPLPSGGSGSPRLLAGHAGRSLRLACSEFKAKSSAVQWCAPPSQTLFLKKPSKTLVMENTSFSEGVRNTRIGVSQGKLHLHTVSKLTPQIWAPGAAEDFALPPPESFSSYATKQLADFFCKHAGVSKQAGEALAHDTVQQCDDSPEMLKRLLQEKHPGYDTAFRFIESWQQQYIMGVAKRPATTQPQRTSSGIGMATSMSLDSINVESLMFEGPSPPAIPKVGDKEAPADTVRERALQRDGLKWKVVNNEVRWLGGKRMNHVVNGSTLRTEEGVIVQEWGAGMATQKHSSVEAAVQAASPGDTVTICEGSYVVRNMKLKYPLKITSEGKAADTVLTCEGGQPCFTLPECCGQTIIQNITMRSEATGRDGVVLISSKLATIQNCVVVGQGGATIVVKSGSCALIRDTHISNKGRGCGVSILGKAHPVIKNNLITDCGNCGVVVEGLSTRPLIEDNEIIKGRGSGVVFSGKAGGRLVNNDISRNSCVGVIIEGGANPSVLRNEMSRNEGMGLKVTGVGTKGLMQHNVMRHNEERAAMITEHAKPVFSRNTFEGGTFGIVFSNKAGGCLKKNVFSELTAYGVVCRAAAKPSISHNTFIFQAASGAVHCSEEASPSVIHNKFYGTPSQALSATSATTHHSNTFLPVQHDPILCSADTDSSGE